MIEAAGVVVPAHNEREHIRPCLRALRRALGAVPVPVVLCVVADRCTDGTEDLVRESIPGALVVRNTVSRTLGEIRGTGCRRVLDVLAGHDPSRVWLFGTDADTQVGPNWADAQLRHADAGADAVTGLVELTGTAHLPAFSLRRYRDHVAAGIRPLDHDHVHGANFGVRASAYRAVGGYRPLDTAEDRDLWFRLHAAGYETRQPLDITVRTSARRHGRARAGLASLLSPLGG